MPDRISCPKCGGVRLITRSIVIPDPTLGSVPLSLYLRYKLARRKGQLVVVRYQYVCELCTHQWAGFEITCSPA